MWTYERRLEYPVKICKPDPNAAQVIISQLGGPNGELGASLRYLNQRYTMTDRSVAGCLTDIGTEELAHMEIIGAILHQLTRNLTMDQIEKSPFAAYFVDHTTGVWPSAALASRRWKPQRTQRYSVTPWPVQMGTVTECPSSQLWPRGAV